MAHAHAYVKTHEDIKYDEYAVLMKEDTLQPVFVFPRQPSIEYPPQYLLTYDNKEWRFPTRHIRFRDYEQLGAKAIQSALASQCEHVELIYSDKSTSH